MRGGHVAFGNTAEEANAVVLGRRERGTPGQQFNRVTGAGYVKGRAGDYARAQASGVTCVPLLVETFGGFGAGLADVLRQAADWRQDRLTSSEYDETTWAARKFTVRGMPPRYEDGLLESRRGGYEGLPKVA